MQSISRATSRNPKSVIFALPLAVAVVAHACLAAPAFATDAVASKVPLSDPLGLASPDADASWLEKWGGMLEQELHDSIIEGSTIYGDDAKATAAIRSFEAGEIVVAEDDELSDPRVLMAREHNRTAKALAARLDRGDSEVEAELAEFESVYLGSNPRASRDAVIDEFLFRVARDHVVAEMQIITYREFLPIVVTSGVAEMPGGAQAIDTSSTGVDDIDLWVGGISELPQAAAIGDGLDLASVNIGRSAATKSSDGLVVDGVRDFLFPAGTGGLDLALSVLAAREIDPTYVDLIEEKSYLLDLDPDVVRVRLADVIAANGN